MEKRYKVLRFVGTIYKVIGIITGILTVIGAIGFCVTSILGGSLMDTVIKGLSTNAGSGISSGPAGLFSGIFAGVIAGVVILIYGGMATIIFYAVGEGIYLAIALEENTRATASLLQQRNN